ncbi:hypothetical protein F6W69_16595 [Microbacterium oxydans]|uniref:alpha/beta hydrolase n=1 Tax=Microbacterium oxydans TaxID=82380 RepID=UPI001141209C|nr:hypothetical protein [Microbacterium oxydans]KAB1889663.1 hypothetical protein F6W69_16595 [Microbacterium oxydans]GED40036.1 carboxylic ester hydrolase [Microbacterium oxydans]
MPWLDIAATAGVLATLVIGIAARRRPPTATWIVAVATALTLIVAFLVEGARWQLFLLAGLAALVAGTVIWARSGRLRGLASATGVVLAIGLVGTGVAAWGLPPVYVPAPTGPHAVGITTTVWTDATRDARGGDGDGDGDGERRSIPATIWYPAEASEDSVAFLPQRERVDTLTRALADQYGMPSLVFDGLAAARANAGGDADPEAGSFPVVIASPGSQSTRWFATSWAEEVASHGVIVIALDHPYDSAAAELADGTTAFGELVSTGDDARDQAAADHAAAVRAADIIAVVDVLVDGSSPIAALGAVDPERIVTAGHSLGGAAAIEAARLDDRISGTIDIDGMPRSPQGTTLGRPAVFLIAGDADPNPAYDATVETLLSDGTGARLTFDGVAHLGLVDAGLLLAPIPGVTGTHGPGGPRLVAQATLVLIDAVSADKPLDLRALAALGDVG